jgi:hypothetical protein
MPQVLLGMQQLQLIGDIHSATHIVLGPLLALKLLVNAGSMT